MRPLRAKEGASALDLEISNGRGAAGGVTVFSDALSMAGDGIAGGSL